MPKFIKCFIIKDIINQAIVLADGTSYLYLGEWNNGWPQYPKSYLEIGMIKIIRTNSDSQDFIELVKYLDAYLAEKDGQDHLFYAQFNKIDKIKHIVVAYEDDKSVGCGAIKEYSLNTVEIKRMYTLPESRGKGIATKVLNELEIWATELGYEKCILETGKRQPEAIELYKKNGYTLIPNYGQYVGIENSLCFEKEIKL
jgi:putative acetyltransferase